MPIITVIIVLIVIGFLLWLANNYIPMDDKIKRILTFVVIVMVVLWLLNLFGVFSMNLGTVPRVHN